MNGKRRKKTGTKRHSGHSYAAIFQPGQPYVRAFIVAAALLLSGCGQRRYAVTQHQCGPEGWESGDTLVLAADTLPAAGDYCLRFGLRTSATRPYPYRSLALGVRIETPDTAWTDTLVCQLASELGDILGGGVSRYQYELTVDTLHLEARPGLHARFYHLMRRDPLYGIVDLGASLLPLAP